MSKSAASIKGDNSCNPGVMDRSNKSCFISKRIVMSLVDVRLIPFYLGVGAYFILYEPYIAYPIESVDAAIVKALPIWSLALFVHKTRDSQQTEYSRMFVYALCFSSLGDMSLIWRESLFIPGMVFFAIAHVCYLLGLLKSFNFQKTKFTVLFMLISMCLYLYLAEGIVSRVMKVLVFIYVSLIFAVSWVSFERYYYDRTNWAYFAASGSVLFMFSDFLIGVTKWRMSIPLSEVMIMLSYYAAQLCLALSTVKQ